MLPALNHSEICESLGTYFQRDPSIQVILVGLVFARPEARLAGEQILLSIAYFHLRSGKHVNFYFAGFKQGQALTRKAVSPARDRLGPHGDWAFSDEEFNTFRAEMESRTRWRYSGGTDLVVMNGLNDTPQRGRLDFSTAIAVNLDAAIADGLFPNASMLFERVFQFGESCDGVDPTWGLSDALGLKAGAAALLEVVLSAAPEAVRKSARGVRHFAVKDISKTAR